MKTSTTYELQAYLAVSASHPRWSGVNMTAINGWKKYHYWEGNKCIRDPRLTDALGETFQFNNKEDALSFLDEIRQVPQKYYLRVVRVVKTVDVFPLAGADIPDYTVVDGPGEHRSGLHDRKWHNTSQETLDNIVQEDRIKDIVR